MASLPVPPAGLLRARPFLLQRGAARCSRRGAARLLLGGAARCSQRDSARCCPGCGSARCPQCGAARCSLRGAARSRLRCGAARPLSALARRLPSGLRLSCLPAERRLVSRPRLVRQDVPVYLVDLVPAAELDPLAVALTHHVADVAAILVCVEDDTEALINHLCDREQCLVHVGHSRADAHHLSLTVWSADELPQAFVLDGLVRRGAVSRSGSVALHDRVDIT